MEIRSKNKGMNITFLISHFPPEWTGGAETQTSRLASRLSRRASVTVLTRKWLDHLPKKEKRGGNFLRKGFKKGKLTKLAQNLNNGNIKNQQSKMIWSLFELEEWHEQYLRESG